MEFKSADFSGHIVFVDESGDHGMLRLDPNYPIFALAFCLFEKSSYVEEVCPTLQRFKFRFWGHDSQVLHEHEIRKPNRDYAFLFHAPSRVTFLDELNDIIGKASFQVVATVIRKAEYAGRYARPINPYDLALEFGLERIYRELESCSDVHGITHVVVEKRGEREDAQLELAFRRICDGANALRKRLPFDLVMLPKIANSPGLQLADLVARPIGLKVLHPEQPNRAWDILQAKLRRSAVGEVKGWGLKIFP